MTWQTNIESQLQSDLTHGKIAEFVTALLNSNPVVNGARERLTEYHDQQLGGQTYGKTRLRRALEMEVHQGLHEALSFTADDIVLVLESVKIRVTKFLMLKHHSYLVSESENSEADADCILPEGAIWFPASFYVLHRRSWKVFGEGEWYEKNYVYNEFYGLARGQRHPALVVEVKSGGKITVSIPISHRQVENSTKFDLINARDGRPRYATYGHPFIAGWRMVTDDTEDFLGHSISTSDMKRIRREYLVLKSVTA